MAKARKRKSQDKRPSFATRFAEGWLPLANLKGLLLISAIFLALYAQTSSFGFVFDDVHEVKNNPVLRGPVLAGLTMSQHDHQGTVQSKYRIPTHDSYRPLRYLSYQLDSKLFGLAPGAMHIHNVLLGLIGIWSAWWFLRLLAIDRRVILGVTLLFALHPVQVESVAYISARSDLHAGIFALLAGAFSLKALGSRQWGWSAAAVLSFFFCMASKEAYLFLPLLIAFIAWRKGSLRRAYPTVLGQALVLLLWFVVRAQFVNGSGASYLRQGLAQAGALLRNYVIAFLWPFDSTLVRPVNWGVPWVETVVAALLALGCAAWLWRSRSEAAHDTTLSLFWFTLLIGPSLLASTIFGTLNDHYLYLPLLGLIGLLAQALNASWKGRAELGPVVSVVFGFWAIAMLALTTQSIPSWESMKSLTEHTVKRSPEVGRAWVMYGDIQSREGGCKAALPSYQRAVSVAPDYAVGWSNLSVCELRAGAPKRARDHARRAVALDPTHTQARLNTALAEELLGNKEQACKFFRSAAQLDPSYTKALAGAQRNCPRK